MASLKLPYVKLRAQAGAVRPRFEPGPRERLLGFAPFDLKHADGRWYTVAEAHAWALAKHAEIVAQRKSGKRLKAPPAARGRSVDDLLEDWLKSDRFTHARSEGGYAEETKKDYRFKAAALRYEASATAGTRVRDLTAFARAPAAAIGKPEVLDYFRHLRKSRGLVMARQCVMTLSAAWKWGSTSSKWRLAGENPCSRIGLPKPLPRVMVWEWDEYLAFVRCADRAGEPELADAVTLALFSDQRQGDALDYDGVGVDAGVTRLVQSKRGAHVEIPHVPLLAARLEAIAARRQAKGYICRELIVDGRTGRGFVRSTFRHRFAALRARVAAGDPALGLAPCPSIAGKRYQDLRDTLLTWLFRAGAEPHQRRAVSGHSAASQAANEAHYFAPGSEDAAAAIAKLTAWMDAKGMQG